MHTEPGPKQTDSTNSDAFTNSGAEPAKPPLSGNCFITELVDSFRFEDAKLPSLPSAAIYLERAIRDDSVSLAKLASLLEKDPVLAARLIRVANSAFYRAVTPVESVPVAVTRIGFSATRNIALVLLSNVFRARHKLVAERISQLWNESLRTAAVASILTRHYPLIDSNRAMLGGLMYNVGAMLLLTKIDEKVRAIPHPMILDQMIAKHAARFGLMLLRFWEMDPDLLEVVAHRDNWQRNHEQSPDLADLILVARSCIPVADGAPIDFTFCENLPAYQRMQPFLHLPLPLSEFVTDAEDSVEQMLAVLSG
ncbi:MAG: HDOD domain-containing protein [Granulosicoccus sp.]